jgi:hypothetical protein
MSNRFGAELRAKKKKKKKKKKRKKKRECPERVGNRYGLVNSVKRERDRERERERERENVELKVPEKSGSKLKVKDGPGNILYIPHLDHQLIRRTCDWK